MGILTIFAVLVSVAAATHVESSNHVYGKYYNGDNDLTDNSIYLYRPSGRNIATQGKLPVIVQVHGGGFTGGRPYTTVNAAIQSAIDNGIAYVSVGYRLVATKYYYNHGKVEELIHVDGEGRLTLDTQGRTMDDYQIRRGRQEYQTKCSYDAAMMMEYLIKHADDLGLDIHRISFTGGSAGGGEIHYLTWVYHQWNIGRYTPVGMVYTMAQLDYPVQNMMDRVWSLWADDVGEGTKLSTILAEKDCGIIVGNPWCSQSADYNLCNKTYHEHAMSSCCGSNFDKVTLGDARAKLQWPRDDPEVGKGMEVLWYNSLNMQKHQPKPFHLYIANALNSTAGMNVVHNALYSRNYAKFAEKAGINYTVLYTDYHGMTADDAGQERIQAHSRGGSVVYNYRSNHDWINQPTMKNVAVGSAEEQLLYHCLIFGLKCTTAPPPSPSPTPAPGPITDDCKKAVDAHCSSERSRQDCATCIHKAGAKVFVPAGCPRDGGESCIAYCMGRSAGPSVLV